MQHIRGVSHPHFIVFKLVQIIIFQELCVNTALDFHDVLKTQLQVLQLLKKSSFLLNLLQLEQRKHTVSQLYLTIETEPE